MDESTSNPEPGTADASDEKIDDAARVDYDKAKAEGKLFSTNNGNRITETVIDGESSWSKWPRQRGDKQLPGGFTLSSRLISALAWTRTGAARLLDRSTRFSSTAQGRIDSPDPAHPAFNKDLI